MSEENITLYDLLNLAIGTPQQGAVNFSALHSLLHAVLRQLGIREMTIRWRDSPSGHTPADAPAGVTGPRRDEHSEGGQEVQPGIELRERRAASPAPVPSSGATAGGQPDLRSRIQTCEDGVSKAMRLIQELHNQRADLKEELKELCQRQMVAAQVETVTTVETCRRHADALGDTVRSLKDSFQKFPDPEKLSRCVTWDVVQSALLSERENLQRELVNSGVFDRALAFKPRHAPFNRNSAPVNSSYTSMFPSPHPVEDTVRTTAPSSPVISGEILTLQEATGTSPATETSSVLSGTPQQTRPKTGPVDAGLPPSGEASGSERSSESVEALRILGELRGMFDGLEARVVALEEGKVDQTQLDQLRDVISNGDSQNVSSNLMDQLKQQGALINSLMSNQEKWDSLQDMFMSLTSQEREATSESATGSLDSESRATHELRQQVSYLRRSVQKLKEDMRQLKALIEERVTDQRLQDQLDDLRGVLEDMMLSLTSQLSSSLQDERGSQGLSQSKERTALTTGAVDIGRKLGQLFQHYEQLQDMLNGLLQQQTGGRAGTPKDREDLELVNEVQKAILQLQAECEKLHETTSFLHEDNRQKQSHIEKLYKTTGELEEKKADKQMVESEIKADKSALESKVSRLQFDSATEQLNTMFHELLNKVTGQEQDWHKVVDKLSTEMECKLNRIELDSVKKQLEDCWRNIHEKLQAQGAPEHEDAAGIRKQLVERFRCLSCDRPVVMQTPGPHLVTLPSAPGFPSHRSIRPFTVHALEQFRQHYRRLKPGTNPFNSEVESSSRRREHLRRSYTEMCRQIESIQRQLRHCDGACGQDTKGVNLNPDQLGVWHERIAQLTNCSQPAMSRSCGGSHTVTSASQRRTGPQYMRHHNQPEGDSAIQSEAVDIVGLDGHIYRGRLNPPANRNTESKLPTISTKEGAGKMKDKAQCPPSHKPSTSPEGGRNTPVHHPPSATSTQCSRSASSCSGQDWPVSALGCPSQSSMAQASAATEQTTESAQDIQEPDL